MDFALCLMQSVIRWKGWNECLHSGGSFSAVHADSKHVVLPLSHHLPIFLQSHPVLLQMFSSGYIRLCIFPQSIQGHMISLLHIVFHFLFTFSFLFLASHTSSSLSGTEPVSPFFPLPSFYSPPPPKTESNQRRSSHAFCDHAPHRRFSSASNALCTLCVFSANSAAWLPAHQPIPWH